VNSYLAIATVTATLQHLLLQAIRGVMPAVNVTTEQPSKFKDGQKPAETEAWVNIFAYQIETDPALRNDDLPSRSQNGGFVQRPHVALKINYLLTFYGNEAELEPQRLLGKVVSTLHAYPVIVPGIKATDTKEFQEHYKFIEDPNLTAQQARVRLTPLPLSLEDLSKLWSVFFQTEYRLSVAYQAAVVLIAADEPAPQPVLPVRERHIVVEPALAPASSALTPVFVLQPRITLYDLDKSTLTLTVEPAIAAEQAVTLWLDEEPPPPGKNPRVYGLVPQARQNPTQTLAFEVSQVAAGTYRLRLWVDRAESPGEPALTWTYKAPNTPEGGTP
jgi:hypothetical protein